MAGIPGLIASIGFKAIAGKVFGRISGGFKAVGSWVGKQDSAVRVLVLALAAGLLVDHAALIMSHRHAAKVEKQLANAAKALTDQQASITLATAKAKADDLAHARSVEQHYETIRKEETSDLKTKLDAALAAAHRVRRAPAANPGSGGASHLPVAPEPAGPAPAGNTGPDLYYISQADLDACAMKTVQADGWQDWWKKVSKPAAVPEGK